MPINGNVHVLANLINAYNNNTDKMYLLYRCPYNDIDLKIQKFKINLAAMHKPNYDSYAYDYYDVDDQTTN